MHDTVSAAIQDLSDPVFRFILRIVHNRDEALDLTQDAFVKILHRADGLLDRNKLKAYIFKIAYRLALNSRRNFKRRNEKKEFIENEIKSIQPNQPDMVFESNENSARLKEALETLSEKQREAITLRFFGDMTFNEIAATMSIAEGSVKTYVARGLNKLSGQLSFLNGKGK